MPPSPTVFRISYRPPRREPGDKVGNCQIEPAGVPPFRTPLPTSRMVGNSDVSDGREGEGGMSTIVGPSEGGGRRGAAARIIGSPAECAVTRPGSIIAAGVLGACPFPLVASPMNVGNSQPAPESKPFELCAGFSERRLSREIRVNLPESGAFGLLSSPMAQRK